MERPSLDTTGNPGGNHLVIVGASRADWCRSYLIECIKVPHAPRYAGEPVAVMGSPEFADAVDRDNAGRDFPLLAMVEPGTEGVSEADRSAWHRTLSRFDPHWHVFENLVLSSGSVKDVYRHFEVGKAVLAGHVASSQDSLFKAVREAIHIEDYLVGGDNPRLRVYQDGTDLTRVFIGWAKADGLST